MATGIYKRTKEHGQAISVALRGIGHKPPTGKMEKSSHWKGGKIRRDKYWYIKTPSHPMCGKQEYVAEHRLVMEKHIGRFLTKEETIHHKNHDGLDNRIENLILCPSRGEHTKRFHKEIFDRQRVAFRGKHFSPQTEFKKRV